MKCYYIAYVDSTTANELGNNKSGCFGFWKQIVKFLIILKNWQDIEKKKCVINDVYLLELFEKCVTILYVVTTFVQILDLAPKNRIFYIYKQFGQATR